jgi:hypothetical protein
MVMFEQSRRLSEPLRWGRREKTAVAVLVSCVVLALAGLGVYALVGGSPARGDCIKVTFASTLGGGEVNACGARARTICASGAFGGVADQLRGACAHAGFPFRPPR